MTLHQRRSTLTLFAVATILCAGSSHAAAIFATSPGLTEIAPPASVFQGALENTDTAFVFRERQNYVLPQNVVADAVNVGAIVLPDGTGGVPGIIPAGTVVDSFYVHYDPVGTPSIPEVQQWVLTFFPTDSVLGVIYSDSRLDASDILGAPGTAYPNGEQFRGTTGLAEGQDDILFNTLSEIISMQSVTVEVDQIRILLAVPEPTTSMLAAPMLGALLAWRRRNRA